MRFKILPLICLIVGAGGASGQTGAVDVEADDLKPGLVASYRSLIDKDAALLRVEAKPAFYLGHSSPHPRIPPGPFEVTWSGVILLKDAGPITFDAHVTGALEVEIDGVAMKDAGGRMKDESSVDPSSRILHPALTRPPGVYRLKIRYRSVKEAAARLQIWWQGPGFSREPLPAWQLGHLVKEKAKAVGDEEMAGRGRLQVERFGCARCHASAFPGAGDTQPGPALADLGGRIDRDWLLRWLEDPGKVVAGARMPAVFARDRMGFVERWLVAEYLLGAGAGAKRKQEAGDHRPGRLAFIGLGCAACHQVPDLPLADQPDLDRTPLRALADRMTPEYLASFLGNPHGRYPDGSMPRLPITPDVARDITTYLLKFCPPAAKSDAVEPPSPQEMAAALRQLKSRDRTTAANRLLRDRGCTTCHPGLGASLPLDVPIVKHDAGCLHPEPDAPARAFGDRVPRLRFGLVNEETRKALLAYLKVAAKEKHPSPFESRQRHLARAGCVRCHQRDSDRPPPIEVAGSTLGGGYLQDLPFQRTPRLSYPHQKFTRSHLVRTLREGVSGLRPARYTYRMPAFGHDAETLVQALAEADGELPAGPEVEKPPAADPTLGPLAGSQLAGFQGYSCVSCHIWNGQAFSQPDPGAIGTDLTRLPGRIRHDWFDRFLENPARFHPGTPMPAIFTKGKPATLTAVLDGDPERQRQALWNYFALGKDAPAPKPPPPLAVPPPDAGETPLVAQVPMKLPAGGFVESISVLAHGDDLFLYDLGKGSLHSVYTGAQVLRHVQARLRTFTASGTCVVSPMEEGPAWQLAGKRSEAPREIVFESYERLTDGVRIRTQLVFEADRIGVVEALRIVPEGAKRRLLREVRATGVGKARTLEAIGPAGPADVVALVGTAKAVASGKAFRAILTPNGDGKASAVIRYELPPMQPAPLVKHLPFVDPGNLDGDLERPGYRAIAYPRPKTASGEDLVMPGALAVDPKNGRVFVASMKMGELFVVDDPDRSGKKAKFRNYARGLFEEAYGMLADREGLFLLHRRNLTKVIDSDGDGSADRFERVAQLPHGIAATYDYGYGLARDRTGAFIYSFAPYANRTLPGSGSALRLIPGKQPQEIAYGFRNPLGWCAGPEGEIFCSDNQGEWVATNKLCHVVAGRFYGFPNTARKQHLDRPAGKTAIWVPYSWARSINGIAYDSTAGKFGPFAGQVFMAELMFGGAIVRANLEKINGEYQGACFPFWGKGLLGPLTLAFDPRGSLYVGGITEPGWMAQPDRGALFRIDYTGQAPFEMQSIHVLPRGYRIVFTAPVSAETAGQIASYRLEHYRYEFSGAYGSPELDRTKVTVEKAAVSADRRSVELTTAPLVKDRVYMIGAGGVRSAMGATLVHPVGAYTLNEIP